MPKHRRRVRIPENNTSNASSLVNGFNLSNIASLINSIDLNQLTNVINSVGLQTSAKSNNKNDMEDGKSEIINAIRTLINADKTELLQTVIQLYTMSKTQG